MQKQNVLNQNKISPEFAMRLENLEPEDKIRVIVLLQTPIAKNAAAKRLAHTERQTIINNVRHSSNEALKAINKIIEHFNGRKLAEQVDLLGSIPIEITAAGINALAESNAVKSIIEDQDIFQRNLDSSNKGKNGNQ